VGAHNHPQDWMRRAAIYVQPSREEALGLALQEAMSSGCACVGTRVGGIPDLLEPSTGLLVPPGDPTALAETMKSLIVHGERRDAIGKSALASIHRRGMNRQTMIRRHLELYGSRI
jgi:glycosyltransferase involved in cell wall biosynthesis